MIERRPFGRTGHQSTVTLFGAAALARASQAEADRTLELLLRHGINHIDTAARYGDSELRIGPWMARHRRDFFLATKTGQRTAREAREDIHRSLERLRVDHVDLIQLHSLWHPDEHLERIPVRFRTGLLPYGAGIAGPSIDVVRKDPGYVKRLHKSGRKAYVWVVDELEDADTCVGLGVDAVITNRPEALLNHLRGRGVRSGAI